MSLKRTPIQELEANLREHPSHAELYLELAKLYLEKDREFDAEQLLQKGTSQCDDVRLRDFRDDLRIARVNKNVELAKRHLTSHNSSDTREALDRARTERNEIELAIYQDRVKRSPENAAYRFQLGNRLKRCGRLQEAMRLLRETVEDRTYGPASALQLGECMRKSEQVPEALRMYRRAVETAGQPEQAEIKKEALWRAVGLANRIKMHRLAQRYLADLVAIDPNYGPKDMED